jgi:SSS family solute:Na+ symporter
MSSGINSLATSTIKDLLEKVSKRVVDRQLFWARVTSGIWGLAATAGATLMVDLKLTILERFNSIYTFFAGPLVGIFLLGMMTKRASAWPVCAAATAGFIATLIISRSTSVHWLWYAPAGCLVTLVVGYLGSLIVPQQHPEEIKRYTLLGSRQLRAETSD